MSVCKGAAPLSELDFELCVWIFCLPSASQYNMWLLNSSSGLACSSGWMLRNKVQDHVLTASSSAVCLFSFLEETDYDYSGSEEEDDELNEDEGEPRLILLLK